MGLSNSPTIEEFLGADAADQADWLSYVENDYPRLAGVYDALLEPGRAPHPALGQAQRSLVAHLARVLPRTVAVADALLAGMGADMERLAGLDRVAAGPLSASVPQARLVAERLEAHLAQLGAEEYHRYHAETAAAKAVAKQQGYLHKQALRESLFQYGHDHDAVRGAANPDSYRDRPE